MTETIILASFFEQVHVMVTVAIFLAIYLEARNKLGNPVLGLIFGFGAAFLVWKYPTWYIIGIILLVFYFGFKFLETITGNIKKFFGI